MKSVKLYTKSADKIREILDEEEAYYARGIGGIKDAGSIDLSMEALRAKSGPVAGRLHLDLNYVNYGKDCMELMTQFVRYYDALRNGEDTDGVFSRIDELAQKMMGYYIPLRYGNPEIEIYCDDALTRCQLKELYYRCRAYRGQ